MPQKPLKRGMAPSHPGEGHLRELLEDWEITITEGARLLEISRKTLSEIVNGKASITPVMALRLEKLWGIRAETWLGMMNDYDLWFGRQSGKFDHIKPVKAPKPKASAR
ncbi:MAG: HigA family addiction module antitoxin [Pseudobacter sp.]|uniref:HigA family addiction module antitoxin n=1 Tax=Pseudobacter sp. TaxID=2045420 RepID=UPI003F7DD83C